MIPISGGNTIRQLSLMQDFGSTVFTSTPSYMMNLAEEIVSKRSLGKILAPPRNFWGGILVRTHAI